MKPLCSMIGILIAHAAFSQCPPTTPTITGTPVLCNGASGSLTVSGSGDTYTWSPGGANTASISISPTTTTIYSVLMGQSSCTLTSAAAITVTVANTPTLAVSVPVFSTTANSFTVCGGFGELPFEASGASTYTWSTGAITATTSVDLPFNIGSPPSTNVYTVTGQNACGTSTAAITLYVYYFPTLSVSSSHTLVCSGQPVLLKALSSATDFEWIINGSTTVIATTATVTVNPTVTTTYQVDAITGGICYRGDEVTVNVIACTGIDELSGEGDVRVYPNPVGESVHVDLNDHQGPGVLEVYDMTGKIKMKESVSGSGNVIPTGALPPGIYFYKVAGKSGKFIKQ